MTRVDVVARRIVPRGARPRDSVRTIESLPGRPGALLIYTNENTYPEGGVFWTRHTEVGTVFVGPAGASSIFIKLHVGAVADVDVEAGGLRTLLHLTPSEDREIVVEVPPGSSLVPLRVQASVSFRPSEIEPASQDTRQLGCYVRLSLR